MDTRIKAKWIERLRSGQVKQVTGTLGLPDGRRCCLGVLCDIAVEEGVIKVPSPKVTGEGGSLVILSYDGERVFLPHSVQEWAGIRDWNPHVQEGNDRVPLAEMNDRGDSFEMIADVIEAQL